MQFYLTSLWGKEYFAKEPEPEPGVFGPLEPEPEPLEKKIPGAGARAAWEKNQQPEPELLVKKAEAGARAAKKFAGSPAHIKYMWENI